MKNKFQIDNCVECGKSVPAGQGEVWQWFNDNTGKNEWVGKHSDPAICESNKSAAQNVSFRQSACRNTLAAITGYIEANGTRVNGSAHNGEEILWDSRLNHVGKTIQRDADDTIWLNYHDPCIDGIQEYAIRLGNDTDDGYGNDNSDIIRDLRNLLNGQPAEKLGPYQL